MGEALPTPNQRMAIGIHAMGEIGRSIWKIGFKVVKAPRTHPIQRPSGIAKAQASRKPLPTRNRDAPTCSHSVPFSRSSMMPVTTCQGVGKMTLPVPTTASHQVAIRTAITARDGSISLSFPMAIPCLVGDRPQVCPHLVMSGARAPASECGPTLYRASAPRRSSSAR